jgi:uncharacterized membrane protein
MLLLAHAAATWFMTGLIWMVQVVHYPLFAHVGAEGYEAFHQRHMRLITWIVAPAMLVEAATAAALVAWPPAAGRGTALLGLALVAVLWLSTALLQVPAHTRLARGYDPAAHRRLVHTNWLRTLLWTARGLLALWMLAPAPFRFFP